MPLHPINRERIRDRRVLAGFTQAELARRAGISKQHASGIENGRTSPSLPVIKRYARLLGCRVADLLKAPPIA